MAQMLGVIQCRCCSGFPVETIQCLFVLGVFLRQELQRDIAAQASVLRLVDHTHPTAAELLCDFVVGNGLADHTRHLRLEVINALVWATAASIFNSRPFVP